jgi:hypothetical protein
LKRGGSTWAAMPPPVVWWSINTTGSSEEKWDEIRYHLQRYDEGFRRLIRVNPPPQTGEGTQRSHWGGEPVLDCFLSMVALGRTIGTGELLAEDPLSAWFVFPAMVVYPIAVLLARRWKPGTFFEGSLWTLFVFTQ